MAFYLSETLSLNDVKRGFQTPKKSELLAEFLGILTGDGYANYHPKSKQYRIQITGDSRYDREYLLNHVNKLINNLFHLKPSFYFKKNQNTMELVIRSKGLFNFLKLTGFKIGKKGNIGVPEWVLNKHEYMTSFVKGLADTDGCITLKKRYRTVPYYPAIKIDSISHKLMSGVHRWLKNEAELSAIISSRERFDERWLTATKISCVELNGVANLQKWMAEIGFSNPIKLKRAQEILKLNETEGI